MFVNSSHGINAGITIEAKHICPMSLAIADIACTCSRDNLSTNSFRFISAFTIANTSDMSRICELLDFFCNELLNALVGV
jgi:hypothetical protein